MTDTTDAPRNVDAGVTDDELNEWWIIPSSIDAKSLRRLIAALRSERDGRAADARTIVALADEIHHGGFAWLQAFMENNRVVEAAVKSARGRVGK